MTVAEKKAILDYVKNFVITDHKEVYTNGSKLVPLFRLEQALDCYNEETEKVEIGESC